MEFLIVFALALAAVSASVVPTFTGPKMRITNGLGSTVSQFPYQVGLSLELGPYSSSWCGGSLIGNEWVLTAAHCTEGADSATVYLGATERTKGEVKYTVSASNIIIHPGWDSKTAINDISLIKIPYTEYTAKIQPVQLPAIANSKSNYVGEKVVASGWGLTSDSDTAVTNDLQWARLEVIGNYDCALTYGSSVLFYNICTSTPGGVSTCKGDSGGPLVLESSNVQVGLTSFVPKSGCEKGLPAAFTRVTRYLDWIKGHTGISY